ncbi:Uncharacterised protein [Mycobacteroides abscessus subsp. massiliense]|nr:Uncharacterised protein [Mycobacteroides abscessus subsp. massiliense]
MKVNFFKRHAMNFSFCLTNDFKNFLTAIFNPFRKCTVIYHFKYIINVTMMICFFNINV